MSKFGKDYIERLKREPVFFVEELWKDRKLDRVAPLGDVEKDMIQWLFLGAPPQRGALGWRGIGKTHFGVAADTCYTLLNDPEEKVLIVSKSAGAGKATVGLTRDWIRSVWFLQHLDPSRRTFGTDTVTEYEVYGARDSRSPSVSSVGIEGQLPNKRASKILADDIETKDNTRTLTSRNDLSNVITEFRAICSYGKKQIVYTGTFHNEDSQYLRLSKKGYVFRSWPKLYPGPDEKMLGLAPMLRDRLDKGLAKPGDITCPHRVTADDIAKDKAEGRTYWGMQCMLLTDLGDAMRYPLRLADLIVFPVNQLVAPANLGWGTSHGGISTAVHESDVPSYGLGDDRCYRPIYIDQTWSPYSRRVMWVDPAGGGTDRTGYGICLHLNGFNHIPGGPPDLLGVGGFLGGATPANLAQLARLAKHHRVTEIYVEGNLSGARLVVDNAYMQLLQIALDRVHTPDWGCQVSGRWSTGQKEIRILETLEPITASHRLVVDPAVARGDEFQRQLTRLTRERNCLGQDGEIESLAGAVSICNSGMSTDPDKAAEDQRMAKLRQLSYQYAKGGGIEHRFIDHFAANATRAGT